MTAKTFSPATVMVKIRGVLFPDDFFARPSPELAMD
jgi:hypothetical protein